MDLNDQGSFEEDQNHSLGELVGKSLMGAVTSERAQFEIQLADIGLSETNEEQEISGSQTPEGRRCLGFSKMHLHCGKKFSAAGGCLCKRLCLSSQYQYFNRMT